MKATDYKWLLTKEKSQQYKVEKNTFSTANSQDMIIPGDPDGWSLFIFTSYT